MVLSENSLYLQIGHDSARIHKNFTYTILISLHKRYAMSNLLLVLCKFGIQTVQICF